MSVTVWSIRRWLDTLPDDSTVGIDDGGLTLQSVQYPRVYFEIGGVPDDVQEP